MSDPINPSHYQNHPSGVECITITEHFNFNMGNAIKYIWRADDNKKAIEDLRKARWYIDRELELREGRNNGVTATPEDSSGVSEDPIQSLSWGQHGSGKDSNWVGTRSSAPDGIIYFDSKEALDAYINSLPKGGS